MLMSITIPETTYNLEACDDFFSHTPPYMKEQSHGRTSQSQTTIKMYYNRPAQNPKITEIDTLGFLAEKSIICSI